MLKMRFWLLCALGVPLGLGWFTFIYAQGSSYFSTDSRACNNCHIMNSEYDSWLKGGHHHVAGCVECHLPKEGLEKWVAKADEGFRHSYAFTFQNFVEPIQITRGDREIVQRNCLRCHESLTHPLVATFSQKIDCLHCHSKVGH